MTPSTSYETNLSGPPVPRDRLLDARQTFAAPGREAVAKAFELAHQISDELYLGGGVWEGDSDLPLVRFTSRRVLGYIGAHLALGNQEYRERALEGLEFLLREQKPSGTFVWYNRSRRGIDNPDDGMYETAIAGCALLEGYRLLGDERYLAASAKAAAWLMGCPISPNTNYNMFAVWHLAEHFRQTGDKALFEAAVNKTRAGGLPGQFASGGWPGHNSWSWYHGIIIRGLAALACVLPDAHPFRHELLASLIAAINRIIREQDERGAIPANPGVPDTHHRMAHILHGLLIAREVFGGALDNCVHGIIRSRISSEPSEEDALRFVHLRTDWKQRSEIHRTSSTSRTVWQMDARRGVPQSCSVCWYPMVEPSDARLEPCPDGGLRFSSSDNQVMSGVCFDLPSGLLRRGDAYRFEASVSVSDSSNSVELVHASVYSGPHRASWDCLTNCAVWQEEPTPDPSGISVPFAAGGDTNYLYLWLHAGRVPEGSAVSLLIHHARLLHDGPSPPTFLSPLPYSDWDCDIMATGVYLRRMFGCSFGTVR